MDDPLGGTPVNLAKIVPNRARYWVHSMGFSIVRIQYIFDNCLFILIYYHSKYFNAKVLGTDAWKKTPGHRSYKNYGEGHKEWGTS